jgi:ClpP class serine protease
MYVERIENATTEQIQAANDMFSNTELPNIMTIANGEAVIKIEGVLSRTGPSPIARFFGFNGTGFNDIIESLQIAQEDPEVNVIRLSMNTPGGTVDGTDETFQAIMEARKTKPVIAENHDMIASAGYWIASAADKITAMSPAAETGSIGVVVVGADFSKAYEKIGIKIVKIVSKSAPDKAPDIGKKEGVAVIQDRVDAIERVFLERVSQGRGVSVEHIKENFGQGGLLIAQDVENKPGALSVGMIDAITAPTKPVTVQNQGGASSLHSNESNDLSTVDNAERNKTAKTTKHEREEKSMDLQTFLSENPAAKAEFEAKISEARNAGNQSGRKTVTDRINKVLPHLAVDSNYPKAIKELCLKVLSGESPPETLDACVTMHDAKKEEAAANAAEEETANQAETPPSQQVAIVQGGSIDSPDDLDAEAARIRGDV